MTYAGIGSRKTPPDVCAKMTRIGEILANLGYVLRSGHANGADKAFEEGAKFGKMEIFLPWTGFNNAPTARYYITAKTEPWMTATVSQYHPNARALTQGAYKMMLRNACQILGEHGDSPVDFVICYTPDGKMSGGTGQAMRLANDHCIPIYNLYSPSESQALARIIPELKWLT